MEHLEVKDLNDLFRIRFIVTSVGNGAPANLLILVEAMHLDARLTLSHILPDLADAELVPLGLIFFVHTVDEADEGAFSIHDGVFLA